MIDDWNPSASLRAAVEKNPHKVALASRDQCVKFSELEARSLLAEKELRKKGVVKGSVVTLHPSLSADLYAQIFAVYRIGALPSYQGTIWNIPELRQTIASLDQRFPRCRDTCDLITIPYLGLISLCLDVTGILPPYDFEESPAELIDLIARFQITRFFGRPEVIAKVGVFAAMRGVKLPSLTFLASLGIIKQLEALRAFESLLQPSQELYSIWVVDGASPLAYVSFREILRCLANVIASGKGFPLGHPLPGVYLSLKNDEIFYETKIRKGSSGFLGWKTNEGYYTSGRDSELPLEALATLHPNIQATVLVRIESKRIMCLEVAHYHDLAYRDIRRIERRAFSILQSRGVGYVFSCAKFDRLPSGEIDRNKVQAWAKVKFRDL